MPEPVGPVTTTSPFESQHRSRHAFGSPSFSAVMISMGICAEDGADAVAILEDVHAEAREPGDLVGEVGVTELGEVLLRLVRDDLLHERADVGAREDLAILAEVDLAVHAHHRVSAGREVEVGGLLAQHLAEEGVDAGLTATHRGRPRADLGLGLGLGLDLGLLLLEVERRLRGVGGRGHLRRCRHLGGSGSGSGRVRARRRRGSMSCGGAMLGARTDDRLLRAFGAASFAGSAARAAGFAGRIARPIPAAVRMISIT